MDLQDKLQHIKYGLYQRIFSDTTRQVFTVDDLWSELGEDNILIEMALDLLVQEHENFNKLSDKIYHCARWIKIMSCWSVAPEDECTKAIMRYDGHKIMMTGAVAANSLHFSTQVPARIVYITDGPSRIEKIPNGKSTWNIEFQHADDDVMCWARHPAAIVIQALLWMGETTVAANHDEFLHRLRESSWRNDTIPAAVKKDLQDNMGQVPGWMQPFIQQVVKDWDLWRTDDNGNDFLVDTYETKTAADDACKTYEAKGHKQSYWIK